MENEKRFCTKCGAETDPSSVYCSICGNVIDEEKAGSYNEMKPAKSNDALLTIAMLMAGLYGVLALLSGVIVISFSDVIIDALTSSSMTPSDFGVDSWDDVKDMLFISSIISIVSGGLALLSCIMCNKKENFNVALFSCAAASLVLLASMVSAVEVSVFIGVAIGLVFTVFIYVSKDQFAS